MIERYFNTEGKCSPDQHYMVRLDGRVNKIKKHYVDRGKYFIINRGRQYGKTTTLRALAEALKGDYSVASMDFQGIETEEFKNSDVFSRSFAKMFAECFRRNRLENVDAILQPLTDLQTGDKEVTLGRLFAVLSDLCRVSDKPVVLLIDEVDSASNNQVFLDFLAMLRRYYLDRENSPAFHSVILAGVYDIKNLKSKIRPDSEHRYNSPWNIAAPFKVNMSFSAEQITAMLSEYEEDNHTGMDAEAVAGLIFDYTSGYPYLVSAICKYIDEDLTENERFMNPQAAWSAAGVEEAVRHLLDEKTPLLESMVRQLYECLEMKQMLHAVLFQGKRIPYNAQNPVIDLAAMFGYITNRGGNVQVANRIFEVCLYNLFFSEEFTNAIYDKVQGNTSQFIRDGRLDMEKVVEKFVEYFTEIYGDNDEKFVEAYGRKFFLLYLKPIINGTGNYYIEAQTRDARRMDVVVDYLGEQFIVELKIWHGSEYNERGEAQLAGYLDYYHKDKGYMVSFNFNKSKEIGVKKFTTADGKTIIEAVV